MKTPIALLIALSLILGVAVAPAMAEGHPTGACPDSFELHKKPSGDGGAHHHPGHPHKHVGNDKDINGDGWICHKHVGKNGKVHVHIDNNLPIG